MGFLTALGNMVGSRASMICAPPARSAPKIAATARSGSTAMRLSFIDRNSGTNSDGSRRRTALPRWARTASSIFSGATNKSAVPSAWASTKLRATGVFDTSEPRTFSNHATESSAEITVLSRLLAVSHSATAARFSALLCPAYWVSCTISLVTLFCGCSAHTLSIGLLLTATSSAPLAASALVALSTQPLGCTHAS